MNEVIGVGAKRSLAMIFFAVCFCAYGELSLVIESARQRYPWNGKIDVGVVISGAESNHAYSVNFKIRAEGVEKQMIPFARPYFPDFPGWPLKSGTYTLTFDLSSEDAFSERVVTDARFSATIEDLGEISYPADATGSAIGVTGEVMVVDLSEGSTATTYPVSIWRGVDIGRFNVDVYKTNKLVVRRIPAGTYTLGYGTSTSDQNRPAHKVTLPNDYFMGIFELTQGQYAKVMGSAPSGQTASGTAIACGCLSWQNLRGTTAPRTAPTGSSVLCRLSQRCMAEDGPVTGWDLPTESQWEAAARGSCTTVWLSSSESGVTSYAWNSSNSSSVAHKVGLKLPNGLGLWDVHGNVWEWTRDVYSSTFYMTSDPETPYVSSSTSRQMRGGAFNYAASYSRLGRAGYWEVSYTKTAAGCRLYCPKPAFRD